MHPAGRVSDGARLRSKGCESNVAFIAKLFPSRFYFSESLVDGCEPQRRRWRPLAPWLELAAMASQ